MKITIINNQQYCWTHWSEKNINIYIKGSFWFEGEYFREEKACLKLLKLFKLESSQSNIIYDKIQPCINSLIGNFAIIIKLPNLVIATVDKVKSYPVFYRYENSTLKISNCADNLIDRTTPDSFNLDAITIFKMSGYCIGKETFLKNVKQLQPGSILFFFIPEGEVIIRRYYKYFPENNTHHVQNYGGIEELNKITMQVFSRMIKSIDGAPIFLPLSGGLDSRLILAVLKKLKYDNITTYTYGLKGAWETKRAKLIAEKVGVKWLFVELKQRPTRNLFHTKDRLNYFRFAGGLSSAPHLAEYYALLSLRKEHLIPENAVIINGQSGDFTSGGHIPSFLNSQSTDKIDIDIFLNSIINKHFSLWTNLITPKNRQLVSNKILKSLSLEERKLISNTEFANFYELHEWEERQSKYVINGQRAYDWFGYEWKLPLWDDELMKFWQNVDWKEKRGQKLLLEYLDEFNFSGLFKDINLSAQYSYFPNWAKPIKPFFHALSGISKRDVQYYYHKYLKYYMTYGAFYPQKNYFEYIKHSKWHRNNASYWVHEYLDEVAKRNNFLYEE
jgi:asparagine synthase (glutamine-hydrolysing)